MLFLHCKCLNNYLWVLRKVSPSKLKLLGDAWRSYVRVYLENSILHRIMEVTEIKLLTTIFYRKMLTSAPGALVKQLNMVKKHWNLCNLLYKSMNNVYSNAKFASFGFLNLCTGALVSMTLFYIVPGTKTLIY
jgi:hypothetical protein